MPGNKISAENANSQAVGMNKLTPVSVLAVGNRAEWEMDGNSLPGSALAFAAFEDVTEAVIQEYDPAVIVSPILASNFDCIDLALLLHSLGYRGSYRAMATDLPRPELVVREVSQMCPRLDFDILESL